MFPQPARILSGHFWIQDGRWVWVVFLDLLDQHGFEGAADGNVDEPTDAVIDQSRSSLPRGLGGTLPSSAGAPSSSCGDRKLRAFGHDDGERERKGQTSTAAQPPVPPGDRDGRPHGTPLMILE